MTGCGFSDASVEELFTLPRMAEEYTGLTKELDDLIAQGYEYASPTGGRNIQSVQMADLDGDGQQEALAFFRMSSDEKAAENICIPAGGARHIPFSAPLRAAAAPLTAYTIRISTATAGGS